MGGTGTSPATGPTGGLTGDAGFGATGKDAAEALLPTPPTMFWVTGGGAGVGRGGSTGSADAEAVAKPTAAAKPTATPPATIRQLRAACVMCVDPFQRSGKQR
ncbi:hypothetical protein MNVI_17300 [Mycobacterium noviomagense]|uniref:Uncharacterized protein n=1 Tax=Mycobacterium noviomagense TaxID=459858 RepID=A0A7I7PCW5_9MYCO|nr:hypothetical protein MNVI_17300 [Mycobacterium noviomagense]